MCTHDKTKIDPRRWPTGEWLQLCFEQGTSDWRQADTELERTQAINDRYVDQTFQIPLVNLTTYHAKDEDHAAADS